MNLSKLLDLRPDSALRNTRFEGYKLSLEAIPKIKLTLRSPPDKVGASDEQYSELHAHIFGLQNHLEKDPYVSNSVYFIDSNWEIQNVKYDENIGKLQNVTSVFRLSKSETARQAGDFNFSFTFVSEKLCVLSDGCGRLRLFDTGDRYANSEWKCIFSDLAFEERTRFLIQDARLEIDADSKKEIHCVLLHVEQTVSGFEVVLSWIALSQANGTSTWKMEHLRQYKGSKSLPMYCALEPKCKSLVLSSDGSFKCVFDALNPIKPVEAVVDSTNEMSLDDICSFTWNQSEADVIIEFKISENSQLNDYKIVCEAQRLSVKHKTITLFEDDLFEKVDYGLTTWNLENESLKINLTKLDASTTWTSLLRNKLIAASDDMRIVQKDPCEISTTLQSEMEDCDFGSSENEKEFYLERIDVTNHRTTHKVYLGMQQPLFNLKLLPNHPSALALRYDVDVCLWSPQQNQLNADWSLSHKGTINAFGYIQASKQQKKYMQCSPDMNYAVICEAVRHIFIYKNSYSTASGLKKRTGGEKISIGQQKLFTMDENCEIIGMIVENEIILLLTEKEVICLQINA